MAQLLAACAAGDVTKLLARIEAGDSVDHRAVRDYAAGATGLYVAAGTRSEREREKDEGTKGGNSQHRREGKKRERRTESKKSLKCIEDNGKCSEWNDNLSL